MNKKYSEMNEFDKIILSHQEDNNDIAELSQLRKKEWEASYMEKGEKPPEFLSKEQTPVILRYLVIEDMSNNGLFMILILLGYL